jgi:hypothetical protein
MYRSNEISDGIERGSAAALSGRTLESFANDI